MGLKPRSRPGDAPRRRALGPLAAARTGAPTVLDYLARLQQHQRTIVDLLRTQVQRGAPDAVEAIKWGMIHYACRGNLMYIEAAGDHVKLGFFRGADLDDPADRLEGSGKKLRHVKVRSPEGAGWDSIGPLVRQAYALSIAR